MTITRKFLTIICVALLFLLTGCEQVDNTAINKENNDAVPNNFLPKKIVDPSEITLITEQITRGEVISLLGPVHYSYFSAMHPLHEGWKLSDGSILHIIFKDDNYDDFFDKYNNKEFVAKDETIVYDEHGIPQATESEIEALREWYTSIRAICAYVEKNGEKEFIFGTE